MVTGKSFIKVCQVRQILLVGFPSEATRPAEPHWERSALANFIPQGVSAVPVTNDSLS